MTTKQVWTLYSEDLKRFIASKVADNSTADDILDFSDVDPFSENISIQDS